MEKLAEAKRTILTQIIDDYSDYATHKQFKVYPQMPLEQIRHYIKLAARKNKEITIQFNPSSFSNEFTEAAGKIKLSPQSSQVILTPKNEKTIHLVQPKFIRHIRLAN